jgi:transposase InsO family protein
MTTRWRDPLELPLVFGRARVHVLEWRGRACCIRPRHPGRDLREMIRDMMVQCVEKRFGTIRAPHPVQWLSDNGSNFAVHKTIEIALALNLAPCSNAAAALAATDHWMEDYNTAHPHSRLGYRSPRKYILSQTAACPV